MPLSARGTLPVPSVYSYVIPGVDGPIQLPIGLPVGVQEIFVLVAPPDEVGPKLRSCYVQAKDMHGRNLSKHPLLTDDTTCPLCGGADSQYHIIRKFQHKSMRVWQQKHIALLDIRRNHLRRTNNPVYTLPGLLAGFTIGYTGPHPNPAFFVRCFFAT